MSQLIQMRLKQTALALIVLLICPLSASAGLPERLELNGARLELAGRGTRETMLIDLYSVGWYLPEGKSSSVSPDDSSQAMAFRIIIDYSGDRPEQIPSAWREELLPPLNEAQMVELRRAYAGLRAGDTATVAYAPGSGTTIQVNGQALFTDSGYGLMAAFVDLWLGAKPVSEALKNALLGER